VQQAGTLGTPAVLAQSEVGTVDAYGPKLLCGLGDAQILMGFGLIDEMCYAGACVEKQRFCDTIGRGLD